MEEAPNSERACTADPLHLSQTLDPNLFTDGTWCWNQDFDSDVCTYRRTSAAQDQRSIEGDVACKAALRVIRPIVPVEDHREAQSVPDRAPVLQSALENRDRRHVRSRQSMSGWHPGQSAASLKAS